MLCIGCKREQARERHNWENREEKKLKKIRKEIFRATGAIYFELLASKLPPSFSRE